MTPHALPQYPFQRNCPFSPLFVRRPNPMGNVCVVLETHPVHKCDLRGTDWTNSLIVFAKVLQMPVLEMAADLHVPAEAGHPDSWRLRRLEALPAPALATAQAAFGVRIDPSEVRLITSEKDAYGWQRLPEAEPLFAKHLSDHSVERTEKYVKVSDARLKLWFHRITMVRKSAASE
ncbi:hypothetical protein PG985_005415 [Apiospora marii]|uniref:uncharacterized protein n=1 Tax=Apiospora marii TaxID=335849 RepID=UPI00312CCAA0